MKRPALACLLASSLASCQTADTTTPRPAQDVSRPNVEARADAGDVAASTPEAIDAEIAPGSRLIPFRTDAALTRYMRLRRTRQDLVPRREVEHRPATDDTFVSLTGDSLDDLVRSVRSGGPRTGGARQGAGTRPRARRPARPAGPTAHGILFGGDPSVSSGPAVGAVAGDVVKAHGDHLLILRRGRLLSVRVGGDALTPMSMVNAWGEGGTPGGWYDEMFVEGDTVAVVGYSNRARATEVGLFDIDPAGTPRLRDTIFVRPSNDAGSLRYATRLIGHRLVMYLPVPLQIQEGDTVGLPAVRRGLDGAWNAVVEFEHLYRPVQALGLHPSIHAVLSCDLAGRDFRCRATGVVGPSSDHFYFSEGAVYVWTGGATEPWVRRDHPPSAPLGVLYRLPLDGSAPGAVRVRGGPFGESAFDERGGTLRALLSSDAWHSQASWSQDSNDVGLIEVPVARFTAEVPTLERDTFKRVARVVGSMEVHSRFLGEHALFCTEEEFRPFEDESERRALYVHHVPSGATTRLEVPFNVRRIEPLGRDALIVDDQGDRLSFGAVALGATPALVGRYTAPGASSRRLRAGGFFFAPSGDRQGVLGVPVLGGEDGDWDELQHVSSSVLFVRVHALAFRAMGALQGVAHAEDDGCSASCASWYGGARPILWGGRAFALTGYELIEGTLSPNRVRARRRVDLFDAFLRR